MEIKKLTAKRNDEGRTILKFLESISDSVPKNRWERAFRNKDIKINSKRISDKKYILKPGDEITVYGLDFEVKQVQVLKTQKKFNVIYEDKNILIVNKEKNVVMANDRKSLDNQILNYLQFKQKSSFVPSSIGRLDKVSSGIVVYAKNYAALRQMKEKQHLFIKKYVFKSDLKRDVTTEYFIMHDEERQREVCGTEGKTTKTIFTIERSRKTAQIITGRKHQIRASLSKLGFPIYGDTKYGGKKDERVFLHSYLIKFNALSGELEYLNDKEFMNLPVW